MSKMTEEQVQMKINLIATDVLPSNMVMLISPPTQEQVGRAGGDIVRAIIENNQVAVVTVDPTGGCDE